MTAGHDNSAKCRRDMWSRRELLGGAASAILIGASGKPARGEGLTPLTIQFPTRSGAAWPLWIAKEGGYYAGHGLDANLVFGVHPAGIAMLVSGEAQMTNYGLEQVVAAVAREPSLVMMGSSLNKGNFALVVRPEIGKVSDLKGKRVGVGRVGDTPYFYTIDLLAKHGLTARDVQWVAVPSDSAGRGNVLLGGQVDASLITAPAYFKLEAQGLKVLDNLSNYDDVLISTAYVFKKSFVAANKDIPGKIIMAQAQAIKRFYEDKAFAISTYRIYDPQPAEDVARIYDSYIAKSTLDRVPLLTRAAVGAAADRLAGDIPAVKSFDFQKVVDMSEVRRLIADGFFEKLFGNAILAEQERKLQGSFA
ncbi:ABC-type nitrate/sulfonate/bicarbonate transport system, substrate-binding protein [Rhizobiales bacterium GAS113]|nr:ABC-type nitrate/sulfonate/bicarbonate transport system, substrate-binding protein [Rhizobiales bacterium GAS113]